jgi:hypothetical protein
MRVAFECKSTASLQLLLTANANVSSLKLVSCACVQCIPFSCSVLQYRMLIFHIALVHIDCCGPANGFSVCLCVCVCVSAPEIGCEVLRVCVCMCVCVCLCVCVYVYVCVLVHIILRNSYYLSSV